MILVCKLWVASGESSLSSIAFLLVKCSAQIVVLALRVEKLLLKGVE